MTTMIKKIGLSVAVCVALSGNAWAIKDDVAKIVFGIGGTTQAFTKEDYAKFGSSIIGIGEGAGELSQRLIDTNNKINLKIAEREKLIKKLKSTQELISQKYPNANIKNLTIISNKIDNKIAYNSNAINNLTKNMKYIPKHANKLAKVSKVLGVVGAGVSVGADTYKFGTSQKEWTDYLEYGKNLSVTATSFVPLVGTAVVGLDLGVSLATDEVEFYLDADREKTIKQVDEIWNITNKVRENINKDLKNYAYNGASLSNEDINDIIHLHVSNAYNQINAMKARNGWAADGDAAIKAKESALYLLSVLKKTDQKRIDAYQAKFNIYKYNDIVEKIMKNDQEIYDSSKILNADIALSHKIFEQTNNIHNALLADNAIQPTTPITKNEKKEDDKKTEKDDGVYDKKIGGETYNPNDYKSVNKNEKSSLEQFISANQDNLMYAEEVELAKSRVKAIDAEFKIFNNAKTKQELKSYTNNYPNGLWKTEANYKIADIDLKSLGSNPTQQQIDAYKSLYSDPSYRDYTRKAESYRAAAIKTEFNNLKNGGKATQADYIRFVAAHKGDDNYKKVIQQANYEIAWIDLKAIEANPTQAKIDAFLSKYSDASYADYRSQASALSGNAEAIAKSKQNTVDRIMAWNKARSQNTIESYADYLLHYPNSTNAQEAYDNLAGLYGKNPELVSWEPPIYRGKTAYEVYNGAGLSSDEMNQKWNNYLKDKLAEEPEVKNTLTTIPNEESGGLIKTDGSLASLLQGHTYSIPVQDSYQNEQGKTICNNHVENLYFGMNNKLDVTWMQNGVNSKEVLNYLIDGDNVKITGKNIQGEDVKENYNLSDYTLVYSTPASGNLYNVYFSGGETGTFFGTYDLAYQALISGGNTCKTEIPVVPPKTDLASLVVGKTFYQKCSDNGNEAISTLTFGTDGKQSINDFGHIETSNYYISGNSIYENNDGTYREHPLLEQTDTYVKFGDDDGGTSTFYFTQTGATNGVTEYCDSEIDIPTNAQTAGMANFMYVSRSTNNAGVTADFATYDNTHIKSMTNYSSINVNTTMEHDGQIKLNSSDYSADVLDSYDYVSWGKWAENNSANITNQTTNEVSTIKAGNFVFMNQITKDLPQSGSASYSGKLYGDYLEPDAKIINAGVVGGNIGLNANFGTKNITGNMDVTVSGSNWATANFNLPIQSVGGGHGFNGNLNTAHAEEARIGGVFAGANATEIGGQFTINHGAGAPDNGTVVGVFGAKKQ